MTSYTISSDDKITESHSKSAIQMPRLCRLTITTTNEASVHIWQILTVVESHSAGSLCES